MVVGMMTEVEVEVEVEVEMEVEVEVAVRRQVRVEDQRQREKMAVAMTAVGVEGVEGVEEEAAARHAVVVFVSELELVVAELRRVSRYSAYNERVLAPRARYRRVSARNCSKRHRAP
jgi:hypothetical protein